jgi:hypothetical protein
MNNFVVSLLLAALSVCAVSCTPAPAPAAFSVTPESLLGTWHSNHDLSMKYLRANSIHDQKTDRMLDQMMGRESVTFTANRVTVDLPEWHPVMDGQTQNIAHGREESRYSVLSADDHAITISVANKFTIAATTYHFDDKDTVWIEKEGGLDSLVPDFREYLTRVP